jgi:hypothetical protein
MSDPRLDPERLAELLDLPEDDPRRRTVEDLPRLRARLRASREFLRPTDLPAGAQVEAAEDQLGRMLERELGVTLGTDVEAGDTTRRHGGAAGAGSRTGRWAWLVSPALRPALAVAALVVIGGGVWLASSLREPDAPVLREVTPAPQESAFAGDPEPARLGDGALRLSWTAHPEADAYTVVFLSSDLVEIARVGPSRSTHLDLRPHELPAGLVRGRPVLWRAVALRGTDEIGATSALPLTLS